MPMKWKNCSDQLPKEGQAVFTFDKDGREREQTYKMVDGKMRFTPSGQEPIYDVQWWRPREES